MADRPDEGVIRNFCRLEMLNGVDLSGRSASGPGLDSRSGLAIVDDGVMPIRCNGCVP